MEHVVRLLSESRMPNKQHAFKPTKVEQKTAAKEERLQLYEALDQGSIFWLINQLIPITFD